MTLRLLLVFLLIYLSSCSSARMVVDSKLKSNYQIIEISEKPGVFSGGPLKFGPYSATGVDHDWARESGFSVGETFKKEDSKQKYRFKFNGNSGWKAECLRKGKSKQFKIVKFGMKEGMLCEFVADSGKDKFKLTMEGTHWVDAKGSFKIGKENIKVVTISKMENSSFKAGIPTGYHFYSGSKLIAAVDMVSKKGPVWFKNELNERKKERLGVVIAALLLNKKQK